jgi:hypothetical protein
LGDRRLRLRFGTARIQGLHNYARARNVALSRAGLPDRPDSSRSASLGAAMLHIPPHSWRSVAMLANPPHSRAAPKARRARGTRRARGRLGGGRRRPDSLPLALAAAGGTGARLILCAGAAGRSG